ncbi:MAG TPA: sigma-54 dependent transcriptional regulator [Pirellulaceae bacterium]|jgi:DNA-binding NtrC family response regulator|nr:sigma-54 dependent transcriptional regulator [Pirellulaceae bacterium]
MASYRANRPAEFGPPIPGLIGSGPAMEQVYRTTRKVARSAASVLILGETGTGKELIATALHRLSGRSTGPLVKVNCGALSESLLESELFGHVRGAFTGAVNNRTGRFEAAHTGSIFLDEINSTSLLLQVKLLRVLQEREFERVGDTETVRVDTRVIAASNRDLADEVAANKFREDLYWRLNVVSIVLPPLRERREDIPALVAHFLNYYSEANDRYVIHIQPAAMEALQDYHWPGNVRELQNYVERAVVTAEQDELTLDVLPDPVKRGRGASGSGLSKSFAGHSGSTEFDPYSILYHQRQTSSADTSSLASQLVRQGLKEAGEEAENVHERIVNKVEKELILQVMQETSNVQTRAATRLGINRNTLHKKLKDYGIEE